MRADNAINFVASKSRRFEIFQKRRLQIRPVWIRALLLVADAGIDYDALALRLEHQRVDAHPQFSFLVGKSRVEPVGFFLNVLVSRVGQQRGARPWRLALDDSGYRDVADIELVHRKASIWSQLNPIMLDSPSRQLEREDISMALPVPSAEELKAIARANHIELRQDEVDVLESMMPAQMAILDQIDALAATPSDSVTRYRDRKAGARPSPQDDPLNAIVTRCSVKGASSGPLKGKRVGVKDSVSVAGIPASGGSSVLKGYVAESDATIVSRMLDAGAEIVATLNMDDFALSGDGRTSTYGPAHNPHNPEYCTGGSSCGSGAALYYDDIDLTIGTDQGGSIRIPASWSGEVGIKPTYGLVPYTGVMSIDPTLDHAGPMARNVSDVALALEVIAGKDPADYRQQEVRIQPYREALGKDVNGLRLGILREGFTHPGAQEDVNAAVRAAASQLQRLGATVEEVSIPDHRDAWQFLWPIVFAGME